MTATEQYIARLQSLKAGDLGMVRLHAGKTLDESVEAFDLFTGLWWPLRARSQHAPRREVAWLIAKLYACCPLPQAEGTLPVLLKHATASDACVAPRHRRRFDELLLLPIEKIEPSLRWAISLVRDAHIGRDCARRLVDESSADQVRDAHMGLEWVALTDDLSVWERQNTRLRWAEEYL